MKTLVYQSFRTSDVPGWVTRCMKSVRGWAADRGFDYQFFDNRFFEYAPDWYREKVKHHRLLVGDGLLKQHQAEDRNAVGAACLAALEQ